MSWKDIFNEMRVYVNDTKYLKHIDGIFLQMNEDATATITQFL